MAERRADRSLRLVARATSGVRTVLVGTWRRNRDRVFLAVALEAAAPMKRHDPVRRGDRHEPNCHAAGSSAHRSCNAATRQLHRRRGYQMPRILGSPMFGRTWPASRSRTSTSSIAPWIRGSPSAANQAERSSRSASSRSTAVTPHPSTKNDALGGSSNVNQYRWRWSRRALTPVELSLLR
jgi:hypothetical protein